VLLTVKRRCRRYSHIVSVGHHNVREAKCCRSTAAFRHTAASDRPQRRHLIGDPPLYLRQVCSLAAGDYDWRKPSDPTPPPPARPEPGPQVHPIGVPGSRL
jgi:hypothetical protein